MTINSVREHIKFSLNKIYPETEIPAFTKIILEDIFKIPFVKQISDKNIELNFTQKQELENVIKRLQNHEPLQYITGFTEFYGLRFYVDKSVLIPRGETEELVDLIIKENSGNKNLKIADIGTGSGCIAISLAKSLNNSDVWASDISLSAIKKAEFNAENNNVKVNFVLHDIFTASEKFSENYFNIIVSNPPYVTESEKKIMQKNVLDYEPPNALFVTDDNPLVYYEQICKFAIKHLKSGGKLYFEINENFGTEIKNLLQSYSFKSIRVIRDLNEKYRISSAEK